jgi:hypothetical protein
MTFAPYSHDLRSSWERLEWAKPEDKNEITFRKTYVPTSKARFARTGVGRGLVLDEISIQLPDMSEPKSAILNNARARQWARVGYAIIVGLLITLLGTAVGFAFPGPAPIVIAATGMTVVAVALWRGGTLGRAAY